MTAMTVPPLPPGYAPAHPPVSGVLTTVISASDTLMTLHRAEYDVLSPRGGYTVHGYASRCTACRHITTGYPADGFSRCHTDATEHECGQGSSRG